MGIFSGLGECRDFEPAGRGAVIGTSSQPRVAFGFEADIQEVSGGRSSRLVAGQLNSSSPKFLVCGNAVETQ
eukprot:9102885-Pyramimonas_sp.AAC.1